MEAKTYPPLDGKDGGASRFALVRRPDGVYLSDGRAIPSADNPRLCVDHGEPVAPVHVGLDEGERLSGAVLGAHVEQ